MTINYRTYDGLYIMIQHDDDDDETNRQVLDLSNKF